MTKHTQLSDKKHDQMRRANVAGNFPTEYIYGFERHEDYHPLITRVDNILEQRPKGRNNLADGLTKYIIQKISKGQPPMEEMITRQ